MNLHASIRSICLLMLLLLVSCRPAEAVVLPTIAVLPSLTFTPAATARREPTVTPTFSDTPTVTLTPSHTPTPSDTFTPAPTSTYTPTPEPPCLAAEWWTEVDPLVVEFLDTAEIAGQTARAQLSPILLEMRRIYRRYEDAQYPPCIRQAYLDLLFGMNYAIEGYGDFQMQYDVMMEFDFSFANEHLYAAGLHLRSKSIFPDIRLMMSDTIWGGTQSNEATATAMRFTASPTPAAKARP